MQERGSDSDERCDDEISPVSRERTMGFRCVLVISGGIPAGMYGKSLSEAVFW